MGYGYWILSAIVAIVGWQYVAIYGAEEKMFTIWRPSEVLDLLADAFGAIFGWLGGWFARISSFLVHLKLERIGTAIWELLVSIWHLVTSGWEFAAEYANVAMIYDHPYLVTIGSLLGLAALGYGALRYFGWNRIQRHWKIWVPIGVLIGCGIFAGFFGVWTSFEQARNSAIPMILGLCFCGLLWFVVSIQFPNEPSRS